MDKILVYGMTSNPGGIESYLLSVLELFRDDKLHFDFVTDFSAVAWKEQLEEYGAEIYFIPPKGKGMLKHWKALWKLLKEHPGYKQVYFNVLDAGAAITMLVPWIKRRKIITHSHNGSTDKKVLHYICRPWMRAMTKKYVGCSHLAAAFMFGENIEKRRTVEIVPNAINSTKFQYNQEIRAKKRQELGIDDRFVVLHVGRLTRQKNPIGLIDIFEQLVHLDSSAVLVSVGTGDAEEQVKQYIRKKDLNSDIHLLGVRNDVAELMQAADVFLLPSLYEGLPIVCVEAQATGLPCVISDNITSEVDLTGRVTFLSLNLGKREWASELLRQRKRARESDVSQLISAGYDSQHNVERKKILERIFN